MISVGHTELRFQPLQDVLEVALGERDRFDSVIGASAKMRELFAILEKVAQSDATVMLTGETGTGKGLVARGIHNHSPRQQQPFVLLDCGAIPRELIESTLFGHEKGAFTGAFDQHRGCFERAHGGAIFLDEIGELDIAAQPKLLRVLENHELRRVGGDKLIKVDARILAATNRDLRKMLERGTFREDLYFRLSVIQVECPPLRERKEDIPRLVHHFMAEVAKRRGHRLDIAVDAMSGLIAHDWPGNVRELRNVVERAAVLCDGPTVTRAHIVFDPRSDSAAGGAGVASAGSAAIVGPGVTYQDARQQALDQFERLYLRELLDRNQGNIIRSAHEAGLTRYYLRELLKRHREGDHARMCSSSDLLAGDGDVGDQLRRRPGVRSRGGRR
jgi:transcriptional regulator with GAF, ATPase, and Fis domain